MAPVVSGAPVVPGVPVPFVPTVVPMLDVPEVVSIAQLVHAHVVVRRIPVVCAWLIPKLQSTTKNTQSEKRSMVGVTSGCCVGWSGSLLEARKL